jgi:dephospho-CoA kinase
LLVTGGIGSGKSSLVAELRELGFETMDADRVGHRALEPGEPGHEAVAARWPAAVGGGGEIDRKALAAVVFSNLEELAELERITHPSIRAALVAALDEKGPPLVIDLSVPGLIDADSVLSSLPTVVVDAPVELRRRRLAARGLDQADIAGRIAAQPGRGEWLLLADVVVPNHGDLGALRAAGRLVFDWFLARPR